MFHRMPCSFHSNFLQLLIALSLVYLTTYFQENLARPKADVAEEKKEDTLQRREISQEDVQQTWRNIIQIQWVRNYSQHLLIHLWNKLLQFGFNFLNCFKLNIFSVVYTGFLICVLTLDSCISGISDPVLVLKCFWVFFFFFVLFLADCCCLSQIKVSSGCPPGREKFSNSTSALKGFWIDHRWINFFLHPLQIFALSLPQFTNHFGSALIGGGSAASPDHPWVCHVQHEQHQQARGGDPAGQSRWCSFP